MVAQDEKQSIQTDDDTVGAQHAAPLQGSDDLDSVESASPLQADNAVTSSPDMRDISWWQMLRRFFFMTKAEKLIERDWRLQQLNEAIEDMPESAVNYLLRGEMHLQAGRDGDAIRDFRDAAKYAQIEYTLAAWGLSAQSIQDKALHYLQKLDAIENDE